MLKRLSPTLKLLRRNLSTTRFVILKSGIRSELMTQPFYSEPRTVTLIPGDGIGPEIAASVQKIFAATEAPICWDPVDVTPVKNPDGTMGIPQAVIDSVNKHKIGLKSPLMTPVGKGFR